MANTNPLVSIVIPTYNQKRQFLIECIESAISQTYVNLEIIISDNHSTNDASKVIAEYTRKDKRIKVIKPENHLAIIQSFLFATDNTKGKYFCIISSDDIMLPTCVEELVVVLENNPDVVFAHGEAVHFTPDGKETLEWKHFNLKTGVYSFEDGMDKFINHRYTYMAGPLIRTEIFKQIENESDRKKYSQNITYSYDTYLLFRMFELGKVGYVGHALAKVRVENETRERANALALQDYCITYSWLEQSSLMRRIPNAVKRIRQIKATLAFDALKVLIYKRINNIVSQEEYCKLTKLADNLISPRFLIKKLISKSIVIFPGMPLFLFQNKFIVNQR
jgi:glycosyltransferase involved in cell wall biosynthesis